MKRKEHKYHHSNKSSISVVLIQPNIHIDVFIPLFQTQTHHTFISLIIQQRHRHSFISYKTIHQTIPILQLRSNAFRNRCVMETISSLLERNYDCTTSQNQTLFSNCQRLMIHSQIIRHVDLTGVVSIVI